MSNYLSVFMKNTDATSVSLGFYYQYESTLNVWLTNYLYNLPIQIFCETEDDIKELNVENNSMKYSQVKCYADSFSLSSEPVKKSLCNFYMLFREYEDVDLSFEFITNTSITPKDTLLANWVINKDKVTNVEFDKVIESVRETLKLYFTNEANRLLKRLDGKKATQLKKVGKKNQSLLSQLNQERSNIESMYHMALEEIKDSRLIEEFVKKINWNFNDSEPNSLLDDLIIVNKKMIESITDSIYSIDLFYCRLLSEVQYRSCQKEVSMRILDNKILSSILMESQKEMESKINHDLFVTLNQLSNEINDINQKLKNIEAIQTEPDSNKVKESFKVYCENKLNRFSANLNDENFSIYDIFVQPNFYSFPFNGDFIVDEDFIIDHQEIFSQKDSDILDHLKNLLKENIVLIHGDPGIGKSSLSKVLFKQIYEQGRDIYPFHIDLKNLDYISDFKAVICSELNENIDHFNNSLTKYNIVLILDGLDELNLLTEGSLRGFFDNLIKFSGKYPNIKIVLTGRTTIFLEMLHLIPKRTPTVILNKFDYLKVKEWLKKWLKFKGIPEKTKKELFDFRYYEDSILRFPLLLYLFCKMIEEDENLSPKELFGLEKWEFYKKMIDWTCATSKFIEQDTFNPLRKIFSLSELSTIKRQLNQNIALAMYHKNYFSITKKELNSRELIPDLYFKKKENEQLSIEDFNIFNTFIVLNYMRPLKDNKKDVDVAFEFIHKTFYEFLASEALVNTLLYISDTEENINNIATYFYESFGGFKITFEIKSFLKPLLLNISYQQLNEIFSNLDRLYTEYVLKQKFLNEHNNSILNDYFIKYPENVDKKIDIESNVIFNLFFLLSFISDTCNDRYEVCNSDENKSLKLLLPFQNESIEISSLSLNNFRFVNTEFEGNHYREIDLDNSEIINCDFKRVELAFGSLVHSELYSVEFDHCNLDNIIFKESEIEETNYKNLLMRNAVFTKVNIKNSKFINTFAQFNSFNESLLNKCSFNDIEFDESDFYKSKIESCFFVNCSFQATNFEDSIIRDSTFVDVNFSNSSFKDADLSGSNLAGADLSFTNLQGVDFTNTDLSNVNLTGSDITNANFTGANLSGIDFSKVKLYEDGLVNCDFSYANLSNANLSVLDLTSTLFNFADLTRVNFSYSNLKKVDLSNALLHETKLINTNLQESNLSKCKIRNSNFSKANLAYSALDNSFIIQSVFLKADFFGAQLQNSQIRYSDFYSALLIFTNLNNTDIRDSNFNRAKQKVYFTTLVNINNGNFNV